MKRICDKIQSSLSDAVQGELHEGLRAEILAHARQCGECAEALEFSERLRAAIEAAPLKEPPALYFEGVLAQIHRRMPAMPARGMARRQRFVLRRETFATALTAALLLIWFGAGFMGSGGNAARNARDSGRYSPGNAAQASAAAPTRLMAIRGIGLVQANAETLKLLGRTWRELGMPEKDLAAISAAAALLALAPVPEAATPPAPRASRAWPDRVNLADADSSKFQRERDWRNVIL
ncbi:MAG: hypothetical protein NTX50_03535 [Candidatus Sumerlaeota bacterium]|nr:hypothetical protein [Candidatus Sumerlaeota bacterium]